MADEVYLVANSSATALSCNYYRQTRLPWLADKFPEAISRLTNYFLTVLLDLQLDPNQPPDSAPGIYSKFSRYWMQRELLLS